MKVTLETLQQALLIFTVIVLVYVLYKRLLRVLGKKEKNLQYADIGEQITWNGKIADIELTLYQETTLSLSVHQASGEKIFDIITNTYIAGQHHIKADCSQLAEGRYYFRIQSPVQDHSLYFTIS